MATAEGSSQKLKMEKKLKEDEEDKRKEKELEDEIIEKSRCKICWRLVLDLLTNEPCRHGVLCESCCKYLIAHARERNRMPLQCPVCRTTVSEFVRLRNSVPPSDDPVLIATRASLGLSHLNPRDSASAQLLICPAPESDSQGQAIHIFMRQENDENVAPPEEPQTDDT